jgi:hypothetical protein
VLEAEKIHNYKIIPTLYIIMLNMAEPFVSSSAVEKHRNEYIQDYNFACGSVWV